MTAIAKLSQIARFPGDPRIERAGPSSLTAPDRLARALGWFSFGLGLTELIAARRITRFLGLEGKETLVRAYGLREIASGVPTLSINKEAGLIARVIGDGLDLAAIAPALREGNPQRKNARVALLAVAGVTALDVLAAASTLSKHKRGLSPRDYRDRSGFPRGLEGSRGIARQDFKTPPDMRAAGVLSESLSGAPAPGSAA
jgi:hypothetical protein